MFYGAAKSQRREQNLAVQQAFLSRYRSLSFDDGAAARYGVLRADLESRGTPIGSMDMMIAAIALAHDLVVVTNDVGEFQRVAGLTVEDWT